MIDELKLELWLNYSLISLYQHACFDAYYFGCFNHAVVHVWTPVDLVHNFRQIVTQFSLTFLTQIWNESFQICVRKVPATIEMVFVVSKMYININPFILESDRMVFHSTLFCLSRKISFCHSTCKLLTFKLKKLLERVVIQPYDINDTYLKN